MALPRLNSAFAPRDRGSRGDPLGLDLLGASKLPLEVRYRGLNISEVLDMPVREARQFFSNYPVLERRLAVLEDVGLDYIRLGQPATTLSGGEAQRIKISRELGKRSLPGTMYILDEPTTGLHMHEVILYFEGSFRLPY